MNKFIRHKHALTMTLLNGTVLISPFDLLASLDVNVDFTTNKGANYALKCACVVHRYLQVSLHPELKETCHAIKKAMYINSITKLNIHGVSSAMTSADLPTSVQEQTAATDKENQSGSAQEPSMGTFFKYLEDRLCRKEEIMALKHTHTSALVDLIKSLDIKGALGKKVMHGLLLELQED